MKHFLVHGLPSPQADQVNRIVTAGLKAVDPRLAIARALSRSGSRLEIDGQPLDLNRFRRIRVVGVGKASQAMTLGLLDVLGERLSEGMIIAKHLDGEARLPASIRVLRGGHPVPSVESVTSANSLIEFLQQGRLDDLTFCLISGGGSALMMAPVEGVTLDEMQALTRLLLSCGADITEINTLRKHLDRLKGGGLARLAAPSRLVTLILSDVIGSPLDVIASGPTVADPSTYADALSILSKYSILDQIPHNIRRILERGAAGAMPETLKPGDQALSEVTNRVIASNSHAAEAALAQAKAEGFHTSLLTTYLQGEASQVGGVLASLLRQVNATGQPLPRPACIISGGETTVTLHGSGLGGRSQELALGAAFGLSGLPNVALLALGTDGEDGPSDAAGAVVTGETLARARAAGLDPLASLQNNDSYPFFATLGDLIKTGPTGTNVNDLVLLFAF